MTTVLAVTDGGDRIRIVRAATTLATLLGAEVRVMELAGTEDSAVSIVRAAEVPEVEAVVVGGCAHPTLRHPADAMTQTVMTSVAKPVLVVPVDAAVAERSWHRVLLPLDGERASSQAVQDIVRRLDAADVDVSAVHVFSPDTVPRFWDQSAHADQSWTAAFLARCGDVAPDAALQLRRGDAGLATLDVARQEAVDLVVLGWSQHLEPGRAHVVRELVSHAGVPVLLVPTG